MIPDERRAGAFNTIAGMILGLRAAARFHRANCHVLARHITPCCRAFGSWIRCGICNSTGCSAVGVRIAKLLRP